MQFCGGEMSEWIKVEDALPELDHIVLAWDGVFSYVAYRQKEEYTYWSVLSTDDSTAYAITHWCLLPNPPDMPD